jgi:acyl dehydratase
MSELSYSVEAYNAASLSDNKIHDDAVARRFGFRGGLVPGVDVYGYMTHLPVQRWGRAWLERGTAECRFLKPVYDGDIATITGRETSQGIEWRVESRGEVCASGAAGLPAAAGAIPSDFAAAPLPPAPPASRPPADARSLAPGTWLAMNPIAMTPEHAAEALRDLRETLPLYAGEGLVHPAVVLRAGNWVLKDNVILGPWMHVGSRVRHFAAVRIGDELSARARVTANYEKKGHLFVECDVFVYANGDRPIACIAHTSIYRPRQVAE